VRFSSNSALSISPLANRSFKISRAREAVSYTFRSPSRAGAGVHLFSSQEGAETSPATISSADEGHDINRSRREVRETPPSDIATPNSFRTAPSLYADMIFGKTGTICRSAVLSDGKDGASPSRHPLGFPGAQAFTSFTRTDPTLLHSTSITNARTMVLRDRTGPISVSSLCRMPPSEPNTTRSSFMLSTACPICSRSRNSAGNDFQRAR
jgi:hypothetical protein